MRRKLHAVSNLTVTLIDANKKGDDKSTEDLTKFTDIKLKFKDNYTTAGGQNLPFDEDYFAQVYFKNAVGDAYVLDVPVYLVAPTAAEISSWYEWKDDSGIVKIDGNSFNMFVESGIENTYAYSNAFNAKLNGVSAAFNNAKLSDASKKAGWAIDGGILSHPAFTTASITAPVSGLAINALNNRKFNISDISVTITNVKAQQDPVIVFAPEVSLGRNNYGDNFFMASNSLYKPYGRESNGEFTLTGVNGQNIVINLEDVEPAVLNVDLEDVVTTATAKKDGSWDFSAAIDNLFNVTLVAYDTTAGESQTTENIKTYGIKISPKEAITSATSEFGVKITIPAKYLTYFTSGQDVAEAVTVDFTVTLK